MIALYHIICFSSFVLDVYLKYQIGWSCLFFTFSMIAVNVALLVANVLIGAKRLYIKRKLKKEAKAMAL